MNDNSKYENKPYLLIKKKKKVNKEFFKQPMNQVLRCSGR